MDTNEIEKEISDQIIIWVKDNPKVTKIEIKNKITQEIAKRNYLKEDWQRDYAKERIMNLIWKKHFSVQNFIVNSLIAIIPASLVLGFLIEIGIRGALVSLGVIYGFIYFVGSIRNKPINIEYIEDNNKINKKGRGNYSFILWIILILLIVAFFSSLTSPVEEKTDYNGQDISFTKTDKSSDYSEQVGNLYRNTKYKFRIKFPENWVIESGDGPNILKKATNGDGDSNINIGVREIPTEYGDKNATIKDMMSLVEFKDSVLDEDLQETMPGSILLDYGETKMGNKIAYWVKYTMPYSVLDINFKSTILQYHLLHNNIYYFVTAGSISSEFDVMESELKKSIATFVIEDY